MGSPGDAPDRFLRAVGVIFLTSDDYHAWADTKPEPKPSTDPWGDDVSTQDMVREFHDAFGVAVRRSPVANPPESGLRIGLIEEEFGEYRDAVAANDVVGVADALADIAYVVFGAALVHGIDLDSVLAEVHRSNMSKLGADGQPILRADGKVLKGPGYTLPDVASVIGAA